MPRPGVTTDRVVAEAADLADEVGLQATTVSAVARRLGIRAASVYSHVEGSVGLQEGLARLALDELADRALAAVAGLAGRDALVAFAATYRDYAREHPGRYAATRLRVRPDSPAVEAGRRHAELTAALLRGYRLDAEATVHATRFLGSLLHGFVDLELGGSFEHSDPPSAQSWERLLDAVDSTLRSWSQTTTAP